VPEKKPIDALRNGLVARAGAAIATLLVGALCACGSDQLPADGENLLPEAGGRSGYGGRAGGVIYASAGTQSAGGVSPSASARGTVGAGGFGQRPNGGVPNANGGAFVLAAGGTVTANGGNSAAGYGGASPGGGDMGGAQSVCPDRTTTHCSPGTWPGGTIYYTFASGFSEQTAVRNAMDRWESASASVVQFVQDSTRASKVTISSCTGQPSEAGGYAACVNGCTVEMCGSGIDHQLGRVIGLGSEHERYDRDHYVRVLGCNGSTPSPARCSADNDTTDFGPFDYRSTMLSRALDPGLTRWNGTSICSDSPGACPVSSAGPGGAPTENDGAAVVDLYGTSAGWSKFRRTVSTEQVDPYDPASQSPFDDYVAPSVTIPATSSPALETWENGSLAVYVRASDNNVYKKWIDATERWSSWESLGAPEGTGTVSDPAIVSWAPGHADLVVRRGETIYIMSTDTWYNWQSLGAPPVAPASAPAITSWGPDRLDVFVRAVNNNIYQKTCTESCVGSAGTWSDWTIVGNGTFRGKPAAVARAPGTIDLFGHGMGPELWSAHYDESSGSGWGEWYLLDAGKVMKWDANCADCSSPAAGSRDGSTADVYIRGLDDKILTGSIRADGSWTGYSVLGGTLSGSPATVTAARIKSRVDLVSVMAEEHAAGDLHYGIWWKVRKF
jgi:hypothetical protein